jgi:hypothetical protein
LSPTLSILRAAFVYRSTRRAVAVCAIGFVIYVVMIVAFTVFMVAAGAVGVEVTG